MGRVFLEKSLGLEGWGAFFSNKNLDVDGWDTLSRRQALVWMAAARISQEKTGSGWQGRVLLKKSLGLDGQFAYVSID